MPVFFTIFSVAYGIWLLTVLPKRDASDKKQVLIRSIFFGFVLLILVLRYTSFKLPEEVLIGVDGAVIASLSYLVFSSPSLR